MNTIFNETNGLQLFADLQTTTSEGLSAEMQTFYDMTLIDEAGANLVHEQFGKVLLSTEICCPINTPDLTAAELYGKEICNDISNFTAAFCDWNLLLNHNGGPYHNRSANALSDTVTVFEDKSQGCYAPILWDTE